MEIKAAALVFLWVQRFRDANPPDTTLSGVRPHDTITPPIMRMGRKCMPKKGMNGN